MAARVSFLVKEISNQREISQGLQEIFVKLLDLLNLGGMNKESIPFPETTRS